ncbi:CHAT domain-containing protein [Lactarius akahatsu]|uniref:CHAT domain-containing protein n=1 Tax=Lactarius akahatsu TaxID=416441 RepID=A0AAD4LAF8_9AGAM|nr:CHAT domain-containing protein [Lactarius akahatsu]
MDNLNQQYPIDGYINMTESHLSTLPRFHPERPVWLARLSDAWTDRYQLSYRKEDVDKSLLHATEAILILRWQQHASYRINIVEFFRNIALSLGRRVNHSRSNEDSEYCIQYLRYLRNLPLEACNTSRNKLLQSFVRVLENHARLHAGDETRTIEEMVGLCHELLNLNVSGDYPFEAFIALGGLLSVEFRPTLQGRTLDQVIECLRKAVRMCPPGVHSIHLELATSLQFRFLETHSDGDYHEAMEVLEEMVAPDRLGDNPSSHPVEACILMTRFTIFRCNEQERPEYIEEAISRCHSWFDYPTLAPGGYPVVKLLLDWCLGRRADQFSRMGPREKFDNLLMFIPFTPTRFLRHPTTSEALIFAQVDMPWAFEQSIQDLPRTREEIPEAWWHVSAVTFARTHKAADTSDIKDIEDAIDFQRAALQVASVHAPHSAAETERCVSLGQLLRQAFDCDGKIEYLEESISVDRHALKITVHSSSSYFKVLRRLSKSLIDSWRLLGRKQDLDEFMQLCHMTIDNESVSPPNRLDLACEWASLARDTGHSTMLTAYQASMSLMQSTLVFTPTLEMQHILLASKEAIFQMPLEYASYLIHTGQPEQAIEVLEQGRSLLWSEMRGFRTSIDQLRKANQEFADKLVEIDQQLEDLTTTTLKDQIGGFGKFPGVSFRDGKFEDGLGRIHKQQRDLLKLRDALISQIRKLPGFETFLGTPRFDTVRDAASRGPVIIINHSRWRCDILVLLRDSSPSLIPTADDFYDRATKLKDNLLNTRKEFSPGSREYEDALRSVLKELYKLVGRPVIDRLRELKVEEQSRVWWCPTSVFCALPLHAMGPIPSDDREERYFSDLYVSSYTPTLSALVQSRAPGTWTSDRPSLLLVGRPSDNLPGVWREIKAIQAHLGKNAHCLVSDDATVDAVTGGLEQHPFLHLACHGYLETGRPFDAWFKLRGEGRLTLLDIVRSRLPSAEFAFLSACHSAELTEQSIADEALHLAAAMQYSGFRSVVGTMWAVVDDDGPELAKHFYKTMSSNQGKKAPAYRRSARALRNAVQKLRQKRGVSLERWVNFVHYGA